jgi:hypothetical protein
VINPYYEIAKDIPLKQGLRLSKKPSIFRLYSTIAKDIPLKQGLRLEDWENTYLITSFCIAKDIPLKQGLRHLIY